MSIFTSSLECLVTKTETSIHYSAALMDENLSSTKRRTLNEKKVKQVKKQMTGGKSLDFVVNLISTNLQKEAVVSRH